MTTTTTQMGLSVPGLGDASPGYVQNISDSLYAVDVHDHSPGKGVKISPTGLNINAPLPFNGNSATTLRGANFTPQVTVLSSAADNGSLFMYGNDLYWLSGNNQLVRLSSGASAVGGVGGDYGSYPSAQITYSNTDLAYYFRDSNAALARLNGGSIGVGQSGTGIGAITYTGVGAGFSVGDTGGLAKFTCGGFTSSSASISGAATVGGGLAAVGGVTQGSRIIAVRGCVLASTLNTAGTTAVMGYLNGATPGFVATTFTPPYAGSVAALTMRSYGATATAGTLSVGTSGLSTNPTTAAIAAATVGTGYAATYSAGTYTFAAGASILVNLTSSGWTQSTTGATGVEATLWIYC